MIISGNTKEALAKRTEQIKTRVTKEVGPMGCAYGSLDTGKMSASEFDLRSHSVGVSVLEGDCAYTSFLPPHCH